MTIFHIFQLMWEKFLKKYNMSAFDAIITPAQGGSLRLFISKSKRKKQKDLKY